MWAIMDAFFLYSAGLPGEGLPPENREVQDFMQKVALWSEQQEQQVKDQKEKKKAKKEKHRFFIY